MIRTVLASVVLFAMGFVQADDTKADEKKGTVTGVVTAKDADGKWIEVKADGEEKARKYVPHWKGGKPADGGGLEKEIVGKLKEIKVDARVRLEWEFAERARVVKIEVLKKDK